MSFEPGTRWHYSGEGYLYVQRVVERLTATPLEVLAERELFEPNGLERSSFVGRDAWRNAAEGHGEPSTGGHRFRDAYAAFSLHTTAAEYGRLVAAMMRDPVAAPMFEPAVAVDQTLAWGLGFGWLGGVFWQWGDMGDFQSAVVGSRDAQRALVCLTNSEHGLALCAELASAVLGDDYARPVREVIERCW